MTAGPRIDIELFNPKPIKRFAGWRRGGGLRVDCADEVRMAGDPPGALKFADALRVAGGTASASAAANQSAYSAGTGAVAGIVARSRGFGMDRARSAAIGALAESGYGKR